MANVNHVPHALLDTLLEKHGIKNDAVLSRMLEVAPPVLSKIRHRKLAVGAGLILGIHEVFGTPVATIRELMVEGVA